MKKHIPLICILIIVGILGSTLPFKFGGIQESKDLFTEITTKVPGTPSNEAVMRIGTGVIELLAIILLLIPATRAWGGATALGTMGGAILTHIILGKFDDLFAMAIVVAIAAGYLVWLHRAKLPIISKFG